MGRLSQIVNIDHTLLPPTNCISVTTAVYAQTVCWQLWMLRAALFKEVDLIFLAALESRVEHLNISITGNKSNFTSQLENS